MEMRIELVPLPVTDVDRAIDFYVNKVGFALDHDHEVDGDVRFVQLTPPGSACSVVLGRHVVEMAPGAQRGLLAVVADADAARRHLTERGVEASEVDAHEWGRFVYVADPDGNTWAFQELPTY